MQNMNYEQHHKKYNRFKQRVHTVWLKDFLSKDLLHSESEQHEVLLFGNFQEGILHARH